MTIMDREILDSLEKKKPKFKVGNEVSEELAKKHFKWVTIDNTIKNHALKWCNANFGDDWIWSSDFGGDHTEVFFVHPEDAILFKLRFETL